MGASKMSIRVCEWFNPLYRRLGDQGGELLTSAILFRAQSGGVRLLCRRHLLARIQDRAHFFGHLMLSCMRERNNRAPILKKELSLKT